MVYTGKKNTKPRIIPSMALRESNKDGGNLFMSLYTGREIQIYDWAELPIYDDVVKSLEELSKKEKPPTF